MQRRMVLLSGPELVQNDELIRGLQRSAGGCIHSGCTSLDDVLRRTPVDLLICEIPSTNQRGLAGIHRIKQLYPELEILIVDDSGDREKIARAFASGVRDVFRAPFKPALVIERVQAILRQKKGGPRLRPGASVAHGEPGDNIS